MQKNRKVLSDYVHVVLQKLGQVLRNAALPDARLDAEIAIISAYAIAVSVCDLVSARDHYALDIFFLFLGGYLLVGHFTKILGGPTFGITSYREKLVPWISNLDKQPIGVTIVQIITIVCYMASIGLCYVVLVDAKYITPDSWMSFALELCAIVFIAIRLFRTIMARVSRKK